MFCFPRRFHSRGAPPPPAAPPPPPPPDAPPPPEDVAALFSRHADEATDQIDNDGLRRCLGYDHTDDDVDDGLMLRRRLQHIPLQRFTLVEFFHHILFSPDVNPPLRHQHVHHDMTLPLSHYFIYSDHGLPDQWRGGSGRSDEAIIRKLKMGVRAIEVTMWPNSRDDDIKIHHGWARNTTVLLTECLKSIKEHAFVASRYPVIIMLEDNLRSSKLQKKAAKVLLDVLGDVLYWPHADYIVHANAYGNNEPLKNFPSPDELMGAVLLSIKPSPKSPEAFGVIESRRPPYGHLITITPESMERPDVGVLQSEMAFLGWVHGDRMMTLNLQGDERALWLMHGFYRANGGCGYVRKPDFLMQTEPEVLDPRKSQPDKKMILKVKVYMGDGWRMDFKQAHTSFIPDLWTSVGIAGVPADTTAMKNTKATENTWVPVWEDEFSFDLTVPEMALLRVEVHQYDVSEKDVFGGQTVLPVSELRPGIRAVALFDRQGNRLPNVRLLMRFEFALLDQDSDYYLS